METRFFNFLTVLYLLLNLCCTSLVTAFAAEAAGGTCGDNLTCPLTDDGVLTFSGTDTMEDYS